MNLCACGCGQQITNPKNKYIRYHHLKENSQRNAERLKSDAEYRTRWIKAIQDSITDTGKEARREGLQQWHESHNDEYRQMLKARWADPEFRKQHLSNVLDAMRSKEARAKQAKSMQKRWEDPEYIRKRHVAIKSYWENLSDEEFEQIRQRKIAILRKHKDKIIEGIRKSSHKISQSATLRAIDGKTGRPDFKRGHYISHAGRRFFYQSSLELAWMEAWDAMEIPFIRSKKRIRYRLDDHWHTYIPDFEIGPLMIELKGYDPTPHKTVAKHKSAIRYCKRHGFRFVVFHSRPTDRKLNFITRVLFSAQVR